MLKMWVGSGAALTQKKKRKVIRRWERGRKVAEQDQTVLKILRPKRTRKNWSRRKDEAVAAAVQAAQCPHPAQAVLLVDQGEIEKRKNLKSP